MDCLKSLVLGASIFALFSGCQTTKVPPATTAEPPGASPPVPVVSPYQSSKPKDDDTGPRRIPKPSTLVAAGDFCARSAVAPEHSAQKKEELYDQARKAYQQALQIEPTYLPAQMGLARTYLGLNDLPRARAAYEQAIQIAPRNSIAWNDLSVVYLREKNGDAAVNSLKKAIEFDPENRTYQNALGWTLARLGRVEESYTCFERTSGPAQAHYKVARMLHHLQQPEEARRHLEAALTSDPQMAEARTLLTKITGSPATPAPSTPIVSPVPTGTSAPIRPVAFTAPAQPVTPMPEGPAPVEPEVSVPVAPPAYILPTELAPAPTRNEVQPVPDRPDPILLLPPPPRLR